MKKLILGFLLLAISCGAFAQNAETDNEELVNKKEEVNKHYVDPSNFSHWSIALSGGFNMFLGERGINMSNENNGFNSYKQNFAFGANAQVEYMVNPYWGILLQYQFAPISKKGFNPEVKENLQIDKNPKAHEITFQGIVNLLNLFRTYHKYTKWNVYAKLGAGAVLYPYKQKSGDDINTITKRSVVLPFGFSVEYSPVKSLGIFFDTQCRWYYADDMNYVVGGSHFDMALYGGLGLRYHIGATKKPHVRVMSIPTYDSYIPSDGAKESVSNVDNPSLDSLQKQMQKINDDLDKIKENQDEIGKQGNENADKIRALQNNVDKLVNDLNKGKFNPQQAPVQSQVEGAPDVNDPYYGVRSNPNYVFFAFDKYSLTDYEKSKIDAVVQRLKANPDATIDIYAYCDPRGTNAYNRKLSLNRANAVVKYMVKSGIERNRIDKRYRAGVLDKNYPHDLNRVCTMTIK
ncbi:MAG: OmpA family protein [Paludibacteraceae bacterium]|nr:OmpA family protein [Paludibacteraceae bacterium]